MMDHNQTRHVGLDAWALSCLLLVEYGEINKGDQIIHCFIFYFK